MRVVIAINEPAYKKVQSYRNSGNTWEIKSSHDTTVFDNASDARDYLDEIGRIWQILDKEDGKRYIESLKAKCKAGTSGKDYMEELKMEASNRKNVYIYAFIYRNWNEITVIFSYHCLTTDGSLGERVYDYLKYEAAQNLEAMLPPSARFRYEFIS